MTAQSEALPTRESIVKYVKQNMQRARRSASKMAMQHKGGQEIVREDDYKGHHVVIRTRYNITVDGKEVTGHIMLTNAGQVHYHGLPNYTFDSAVDLVRALIDNFPDDFQKGKQGSRDRREMAGRGGDPTSMGGMRMLGRGGAKRRKAASKKEFTAKSKRRFSNPKSR